MKTLLCIIAGAIALPICAEAAKHPGWDREGKNAANREEFLNDRKDTHFPGGEAGKDLRLENTAAYHRHTMRRIETLLRAGALDEKDGTVLKQTHEKISAKYMAYAEDGMTKEETAVVRGELDKLNDEVNTKVTAKDAGANRTPILNAKENRVEEKIEYGVRSGRLTKGQASILRNKLERLQKMEERYKSAELSTRERERLHAEMNEIQRDLHKELVD